MSHKQRYLNLVQALNDTWLIVDPGIIKLLCATIVAHRLPGDPVWLFVVAGSSGGKSELLTAFTKVEGMTVLDTLTAQTFISGQKKASNETSLLFKLNNGIICIKDFTTIIGMQQDTRSEIMSQLRKIYDGDFQKSFGTGESIRWKGKIGMLAGVTTVIYTSGVAYAAMGERFIMYKLILPDRIEVTRRAASNTSKVNMQKRREEIQEVAKEYLDKLEYPTTMPEIDEALREELIQLANFATLARSAVERNWRSPKKEITFTHDPEVGTRFVTQLMTLAAAFQVMNGTNGGSLPDEDKHILYKIALDSINQTRRMVMQELVRYQEVETAGLATKLNYPTDTVRIWLEDLNALKLVDRIKGGNADRWRMREPYKGLMSKFDGISMLQQDLKDSDVMSIAEVDPTMVDDAVKTALDVFGGEVINEEIPLPTELGEGVK